ASLAWAMPPPPATPRALGYVHAAGARAFRGYPNPARRHPCPRARSAAGSKPDSAAPGPARGYGQRGFRVIIRRRSDNDLAERVALVAEVPRRDGYPMVWPDDPAGFLAKPGLLGAWV